MQVRAILTLHLVRCLVPSLSWLVVKVYTFLLSRRSLAGQITCKTQSFLPLVSLGKGDRDSRLRSRLFL
jgi:hypothetical protein